MIVAVIGIFALLALLQIPRLIKRKMRKELILCSLLFGIGFTINLLLVLNVPLTNPLKPIEGFLDMVHLHY